MINWIQSSIISDPINKQNVYEHEYKQINSLIMTVNLTRTTYKTDNARWWSNTGVIINNTLFNNSMNDTHKDIILSFERSTFPEIATILKYHYILSGERHFSSKPSRIIMIYFQLLLKIFMYLCKRVTAEPSCEFSPTQIDA